MTWKWCIGKRTWVIQQTEDTRRLQYSAFSVQATEPTRFRWTTFAQARLACRRPLCLFLASCGLRLARAFRVRSSRGTAAICELQAGPVNRYGKRGGPTRRLPGTVAGGATESAKMRIRRDPAQLAERTGQTLTDSVGRNRLALLECQMAFFGSAEPAHGCLDCSQVQAGSQPASNGD